ncbi:hypothetical protein [Amycolatopsis sp. NPDC049868]|uniref:hypothetical protein n=1 Tax=Amycolatopsis sp. NPDC049868 TaxID=3363934 RepID=UPI00379DD6E2
MITDATHSDAPASLSDRVITVARLHRAIAPRAFADRHGARSSWNRRAITTSHIAAALGVGVDTVLVRDDPDRHYGTGATGRRGRRLARWGPAVPRSPGHGPSSSQDHITNPDRSGMKYQRRPSLVTSIKSPGVRLGAHLDVGAKHRFHYTAPFEFHGDPAHHPHCLYSAHASELRAGQRKGPCHDNDCSRDG